MPSSSVSWPTSSGSTSCGGRTPFLGGVQPLQRARGLPGRGLPTHQEHPARPRDRPDTAALQSSGAGGRAHRHVGSGVGRPGRVRHRRSVIGSRARRFRDRPFPQAPDVGRRLTGGVALHDRGAFHRPLRTVGDHAAAQRRPKAAPETASARMGGVQQARHHPPRGAKKGSGPSRSRSSTRRRPGSGSTTTTPRSKTNAFPSATR